MPSKFSGKQKRLVPQREPNGRHQRGSATERKERTRSVVLGQPHRKGDDPKSPDPKLATPIGRLIARKIVKAPGLTQEALWQVVEEYERRHANYRRALDSRRPLAVAAGPAGREMSRAEADEHEEKYNKMRKALRDTGYIIDKAVVAVIEDGQPTDDENDYLPWVVPALAQGLAALAQHFGWARINSA